MSRVASAVPERRSFQCADVLIVLPRILVYRVPFFEILRRRLASDKIRLRVVHGEARGDLRLQRDDVELDWAERVTQRTIPGTRGRGVWLPVAPVRRGAELIVVPEAAGSLATYELLTRRRIEGFKVACWGHGPGAEDQTYSGASRSVRTTLARRFDWWFSYTEGTTRRLRRAGVSATRVTTLYNTIDVVGVRRQLAAIAGGRTGVRRELGLPGPTALFIGALRENKRIDLLLEVADAIAGQVPGFTLLVAGGGPQRRVVEATLPRSPWLRLVGPTFGREKARLLAAADVLLHPAALGLVVNDGLAAGLPVVTFDEARHGPEEEYLKDGIHGIRVPGNDSRDLAAATVDLLRDPSRLKAMGVAAYEAGSELTIERMADRFAEGVMSALSGDPVWRRQGSL